LSSPSTQLLSYDGTKLLASAITAAGGTEKDKLIAALQKSDYKDATTGEISFTDKHTLVLSNVVLLEGGDGGLSPIEDRGHTCPTGQHECRVTDCCPN
jgi:ABC-type branched-subunit amino acid transport system substrate-binding protein